MPHYELPIPSNIQSHEFAAELVRCWYTSEGLQVTLKPDIGDPKSRNELSLNHKHASAWGMLLHEIASHAANALAGESDEEYWEILRRISASFQTQMIFGGKYDEDEETDAQG